MPDEVEVDRLRSRETGIPFAPWSALSLKHVQVGRSQRETTGVAAIGLGVLDPAHTTASGQCTVNAVGKVLRCNRRVITEEQRGTQMEDVLRAVIEDIPTACRIRLDVQGGAIRRHQTRVEHGHGGRIYLIGDDCWIENRDLLGWVLHGGGIDIGPGKGLVRRQPSSKAAAGGAGREQQRHQAGERQRGPPSALYNGCTSCTGRLPMDVMTVTATVHDAFPHAVPYAVFHTTSLFVRAVATSQ